jgi:hypothetical protein
MAKIDFHVIPFLCIMYLLAFLGMSHIPLRCRKQQLINSAIQTV